MNDLISDIIDRILRFSRSSSDSTSRFSALEHDKDLLPRFQTKLEQVLESYGKFSPITYDTQGFRDQGVDIVVRLADEAGEFVALIGFQIKSSRDLLEKHFMRTLKGQYFDSRAIRGLRQYYIVLCVDSEKNKTRIRAIENEFKNTAKTKVIEPEFTDTFLTLTQERLDAYIKRTLAGGDVVLKKALEIVNFPSRMTGAVVIYLTVQQYVITLRPIEISALLASAILREFHQRLLKYAEDVYEELRQEQNEEVIDFNDITEVAHSFDQQIVEDIEVISDDVITLDGDLITVRFDQVTPIVALALEAVVRYDYEPNATTAYLLDLLGLDEHI